MAQPVIPSAAATLVLVRDRPPSAVETLLLQRHAKSKFAAGDYVFAGGKVEADDMPADGEGFCRGLTAEMAAARLGGDLSPREALSYWVGAIREAFEEVGVLLAYGPDGELLRITADRRERYAAYRAATQKADPAFFDMLRAERLTLATDRVAYFAHWITPAEAFQALKRKEIGLRTPTIKNLELVQQGGAPAERVLAQLGGREVPTIRPRILQVNGKPVPVLPGDPRWY